VERPTSVTVFGILNICKGALGVLTALWSLMLFSSSAAASNPVTQVMLENPTYTKWMKTMVPIGIVVCCASVLSGFGLLGLRSWARKVSIAYAIYGIVVVVVTVPINFFVLLPAMLEKSRQFQGPEAAGMISSTIGSVLGVVLGLIYPILLLIFMTRPKVVAAFQVPPPRPLSAT
jgi:hypothetical protein